VNGDVVWVSTVYVQGGNVPRHAAGAYAIIVAAGSSIEMALRSVRALCERERYVEVEVTSCRKIDPDDPDDDLEELLRERALRVKSSGEAVVATLHTFPRGQ
jgi:hypothetical protein